MKKDQKIFKIIGNPFIQGIAGWITTFTTIVIIFKYGYSLMINYPIYFIIFMITGFIVMSTVYSIHTYYIQKREIKNIKNDQKDIRTENTLNVANMLYIFANNKDNLYCQFSYLTLSLGKYIEAKNNEMVRQILNELVLIIKDMDKKKLEPKDISRLNEILDGMNKNKFATELQQIKKAIYKTT